jgi:hypothetical protein
MLFNQGNIMIKKLVAIFALAVMSSVSFAQIDTRGLTDAQVAELKAIAAQKVAESVAAENNTNPVTVGVTLAATWGQQAASAAEGFARAMGIAARELNVTINEFLQSDAGKLTAVLIIWKVAGASLVSLLYGMLIFISGQVIARIIYNKLFTREYKEVSYERLFGMFKGTKMVRVPKPISELNKDGEWFAFNLMLGVSIGSAIIAGIIIV